MTQELWLLAVTAAGLGFTHTLLGPDHYIPFVALAQVRHWRITKTLLITLLCGLGHVGSSLALGFGGVALGSAVFSIEAVEALRGDLAAWLLIAFGLAYMLWGLRQAYRRRPHTHPHVHVGEEGHAHTHTHADEDHAHMHEAEGHSVTPWVLFIIFILGPCEPLIPLIVYPAVRGEPLVATLVVASAFMGTTLLTMAGTVVALFYGLSALPLRRLERYTPALAGLAILLCGLAIKFLGF